MAKIEELKKYVQYIEDSDERDEINSLLDRLDD